MKRENFEGLLKSKLDRIEVRPPADMWERLEKQLPEIRRELSPGGEEIPGQGEALPAPRIRRPLRHKMRWAYVAASVAAVGMMVFSLQNLQDESMVAEKSGTDTVETDRVTGPVVPVADSAKTDAGQVPARVTNPPVRRPAGTALIAGNTPAQEGRPGTAAAVDVTDGPQQVTDGPSGTVNVPADPPGTSANTGPQPHTDPQGGDPGQAPSGRAWNDPVTIAEWKPAGKQRRVSTSVFAMNAAGTNSLSGNVYSRTKLMNSTLVIKDVDGYPDDDEFASAATRISTEEYKLKHDLPLSFGASVNIGLWNRVSVETGLTYTYMRSKGETTHNTSASATSTLTQKLHYLGIPLKVRYDFLQTRIADLYVSGGGSIEKLLSGKRFYRYYDLNGNVEDSNTDVKVKVGSLQGSVGLNLGVQFNIDRTFGLYLEPGIGYFFENGNQPESYRTENPFNFTVKAGFRVNL